MSKNTDFFKATLFATPDPNFERGERRKKILFWVGITLVIIVVALAGYYLLAMPLLAEACLR